MQRCPYRRPSQYPPFVAREYAVQIFLHEHEPLSIATWFKFDILANNGKR